MTDFTSKPTRLQEAIDGVEILTKRPEGMSFKKYRQHLRDQKLVLHRLTVFGRSLDRTSQAAMMSKAEKAGNGRQFMGKPFGKGKNLNSFGRTIFKTIRVVEKKQAADKAKAREIAKKESGGY